MTNSAPAVRLGCTPLSTSDSVAGWQSDVLDARIVAATDPVGRERFLREGQTTAGFSHRHAVTVSDAGEDDGDRFIVMELVDGPSLADWPSRTGQFPVDERRCRPTSFTSDLLHVVRLHHRRTRRAARSGSPLCLYGLRHRRDRSL